MMRLAGARDPSDFTLAWLRQWSTHTLVGNKEGVPLGYAAPRPAMDTVVIQPWLARSDGRKLDLTKAPFRLLAITNRIDLGQVDSGAAGEGRFVFGLVDPQGQPLPFTVIFEYHLPARTPADVIAWARGWHQLGSLPLGSRAYNDALQTLTDRFTGVGVATGRPNGSALAQVRTNEVALAPRWQLREFQLASDGSALLQTPVAQTADLRLNDTQTLGDYINREESRILAGSNVLPSAFQAIVADNDEGLFWNAPSVRSGQARHLLSVNSCNGCHAGETNTQFVHIHPRQQGESSRLSTYLTGGWVLDPATRRTIRRFGELERRAGRLQQLLCAYPL
jgi:hypothetical protein